MNSHFYFYIILGETMPSSAKILHARPLGGSLLRACSKKQGSEALAHN